MRPLARTLAACFPDDPTLAREVAELLKPQDADLRKRAFFDVNFAILEVLWGEIHGGTRREEPVTQLAKDVNALLWSRGEILAYSAETIGWKLRDLGIPRRDSSAGREVQFGRVTSAIVHKLSFGLSFCEEAVTNCPDCQHSDTK